MPILCQIPQNLRLTSGSSLIPKHSRPPHILPNRPHQPLQENGAVLLSPSMNRIPELNRLRRQSLKRRAETTFLDITSQLPSFYNSLPPKSSLRQSVLHHFSQGKDHATLADFLGVSIQTIEDENNVALQLKSTLNLYREKTTPAEIQKIQEFWFESTIPVPWKTKQGFLLLLLDITNVWCVWGG